MLDFGSTLEEVIAKTLENDIERDHQREQKERKARDELRAKQAAASGDLTMTELLRKMAKENEERLAAGEEPLEEVKPKKEIEDVSREKGEFPPPPRG